jgi:hypothetical protein
MLKKLFILLLIVACSACKKNQQKTACGTQICSDYFASVGISFKDKNNNAVNVTNYSVVDLRTNKTLTNVLSTTGNTIVGFMIVVDDSNLKDLSTDGDNVKVSGTNPATNEIQTATLKIAGGCNCHVSKISGPDVITFTK